jgi:glycosyltransferase involved in cell wall biosynthesis
MGDKITCLIPCYNGARTIERVVESIPEYVSEIIIVNDGSKDNTTEVLKRIKDKRVRVITHDPNRGYGATHKTLFNAGLSGDGDYLVTIHADLAHDASEINGMVMQLKEGDYDFVTGTRIVGLWKKHRFLGSKTLGAIFHGEMPFYIYIANRLVTGVQNVLMGTNVVSFHDALRVFKRDSLKRIPYNNFLDRYFFDTELLVKASELGMKFGDHPASTHYTDEAGSHVNYVGYALTLLKMALKYRLSGKLYDSWKNDKKR